VSGCGYGSNDVNSYVGIDDKCYVDISSMEYEDLVKLERLLVYNSSIIKMVVYVWN
jgi:hypothetical protein